MKYFLIDTHFEAFRQGCPGAFNAIYKHYHRRIYWMGRSLIRDVFVVESLVQDTFLTLWEKREDIESPKHLVNFLYTVISSECTWYYTRPRNQFHRSVFALDTVPRYQDYMLGHDPDDMDHHLMDQQKRQLEYERVISILPLLGTRRKRLIELCLEHGFKYATISQHMGISITQARLTMKSTIGEIKNILHQGYIRKPEENSFPVGHSNEMTPQQAQVLDLRCEQHYSFAEIATQLNLSQKEVHRAFTTAYRFLQGQGRHLRSA
tara:strand:+ start:222 stop:1013 length:792 start_codon:yes stop_codon:yes gene_type:complete